MFSEDWLKDAFSHTTGLANMRAAPTTKSTAANFGTSDQFMSANMGEPTPPTSSVSAHLRPMDSGPRSARPSITSPNTADMRPAPPTSSTAELPTDDLHASSTLPFFETMDWFHDDVDDKTARLPFPYDADPYLVQDPPRPKVSAYDVARRAYGKEFFNALKKRRAPANPSDGDEDMELSDSDLQPDDDIDGRAAYLPPAFAQLNDADALAAARDCVTTINNLQLTRCSNCNREWVDCSLVQLPSFCPKLQSLKPWSVNDDELCTDCASNEKVRNMFSYENVTAGLPTPTLRYHPALDRLTMFGELLLAPVVVYMQVFTLYVSGQYAFARHTIAFEAEDILATTVPRSRAPILAIKRATRETAEDRKKRVKFKIPAQILIDAYDVLVERHAWKVRGISWNDKFDRTEKEYTINCVSVSCGREQQLPQVSLPLPSLNRSFSFPTFSSCSLVFSLCFQAS